MSYLLHLLTYLGIYVIMAMSLNIIIGYCGLLTLAHAGYFAVGSYAYALATLKLGWGFLPATGLGVGVAVLLSLAVSLPAWRFKGDSFVLLSLSVQALFFSLFYNWFDASEEPGTWTNLTNGPFGLANIPRPAILGIELDTPGSMAALSLASAVACGILSWRLLSSPWGRLLKAMRDDELAARGLGKNTRLARVQAFAIACGMVAVAGAIYASYVSYIDPNTASLDASILMLSMVIVGGAGNFRGPLVGALILLAIPEALRFAQIPQAAASSLRLMAYGLLLILMMHFRPQGLAGDYRIE
ncbi:MAG: branched-chain amino acid ABC transporter permease [Candidatus Eisenbacteria sp.]|nr:branched-chain amino acid ABC transporter permease [Candidatus Eisenbacteria bacterium]